MSNELKILVVDDDPVIRTLLERFLSPRYDVSCANNGKLGLEALKENDDIDLVLCDIDMPEMDGITMLKLLRTEFPDVGAIMISGSTDTRTAIKAIREGAYDYISKPFSEFEEIDIVIGRWRQQQSLETKLAQYATLHREMMQNMKIRTFLAVDVVGSGKVKQGEDPFIVQFVFKAYQDFVESIVVKHNGTIHSTSGDGAMACFEHASDAVAAGDQILSDLSAFNSEKNQLNDDFQLRLGVHTGQVVIDKNGHINEMFAESLDIAGHIQKAAKENSLTISENTLKQLSSTSGFVPCEKEVDGISLFDLDLSEAA